MFIMTADIKIGPFKPVKPHSLNWESGIANYSNKATIKLPAIAFLKCNDNNSYEKVDTAQQFEEGMKVECKCGYNGNNKTVFKGFLRRINFTTPLELECEGYSYQLRQKKRITKVYRKGTYLKTVLEELIQGTDIKLFEKNPSIKIESNAIFRNVSGVQILDWIKEKLLQTVYFKNEVLYCGLRETETIEQVKFRLGWNVIKDNDLKFTINKEYAEVNITLAARVKDGTYKKKKGKRPKPIIKDGATKYKRLSVALDEATIARTAEQERKKLTNIGYEGSITTFAEPYVEMGMGAHIYDLRYPERTGIYFIESVSGEFGPNGGRQKIKIGNTLGT